MESIIDQHNIGFPIFEYLFGLPTKELKELLNEICGDKFPDDFFKECSIHKKTKDDTPDNIEMWYYDGGSISPFGIIFQPENGTNSQVIQFNKFFKLDIPKKEELKPDTSAVDFMNWTMTGDCLFIANDEDSWNDNDWDINRKTYTTQEVYNYWVGNIK